MQKDVLCIIQMRLQSLAFKQDYNEVDKDLAVMQSLDASGADTGTATEAKWDQIDAPSFALRIIKSSEERGSQRH
jgi:hypothetical protein